MARDDSDARRRVALCTWFALATAALGGALLFFPELLPMASPWAQLALGIITLILAFRARAIGTREVENYDGRLSLAAAIAGFPIIFFSGQVAFGIIAGLTGSGS